MIKPALFASSCRSLLRELTHLPRRMGPGAKEGQFQIKRNRGKVEDIIEMEEVGGRE